jgi:hypothetical protein
MGMNREDGKERGHVVDDCQLDHPLRPVLRTNDLVGSKNSNVSFRQDL